MKGEGQNIYVYLKTQDSFPTKDRKSPGTVQNHETFLSTALDFEGFNLRKSDTCSCDDYDYILILCTVNMFDSNKVYIFQSSHVKVHIAKLFHVELLFRYRFVPIKYHDFDKVLMRVSFLIYFSFQILLQILFEK